ncbi:HAD family hydrolase [Komagataeibacter sp. NFXK3]
MHFDHSKWNDIDLVCFDVDGTLYNQKKLRLFMIREILAELLITRQMTFIRILKVYREMREEATHIPHNFEPFLITETVKKTGCSEQQVRDTVTEWIHERPLRYLAKCRYAGVVELFARLQACGKRIGIFSDYPAKAKIAALGLRADYIACAGDEDTPRLKPDPQGLFNLIAKAGAKPTTTLLIGDRPERDGLAARNAGTYVLIRSSKADQDYQTFEKYIDNIFSTNSLLESKGISLLN